MRVIKGIEQHIVVFSGLPGMLLQPPILSTGKRFLHIHGGVAPEYRGSTAFYYSLLRDGVIGATALFLDQNIDTGPIVGTKSCHPDPGVEIDRIQDPLIRADLLVDTLARIQRGEELKGTKQNTSGTTYHVIHPVLKLLALNKRDAT